MQFLFGFLLAVTFTEAFARVSGFDKVVHLIAGAVRDSVGGAADGSRRMAPPTSPSLFTLFRQGQRPVIVDVADRLARYGLTCLAIAMIATVLLLVKVVAGTAIATVFTVLIAALFATLWFVLPWRTRSAPRTTR